MATNKTLSLVPAEKSPHRVLDIGAGTGIWAIEFGELHPESHVTGVDLAPQQPGKVPPNVQFEIDDIEEDSWAWRDPFDYIHMHVPQGTISDISKLLRQCFENTTADGWLEMQVTPFPFTSYDRSLHEGTALYKWGKRLEAGIIELGHKIVSLPQYKALMQDAGYVDVKEVSFDLPSSGWPGVQNLKELGEYHLCMMLDGLEGLSLAPMIRPERNKMSYEELQVFLAEVRKDLKNPEIHAVRKM